MEVLTEALLTFVLNAAWQVALIALVAFACVRLLRGTAAQFRHRVWVAALLFAVLVPAWSCIARLKDRLHQESIRERPTIARTLTAPVELSEAETITVEARPLPQSHDRALKLITPIHLNRNLGMVLIGLYSVFLLYQSAKLFRAWRRTKAIIRHAYSFAPAGALPGVIERCQRATKVRRVRILCSASVSVPITAGVLKPLVIVPGHLLNEDDHNLLTSAIGHEFVHVARRDYLLNLIYELVSLPLSFHPAAQIIRANIKRTRELCCDERVANDLVNSRDYAQSLVRLIGTAPFNECMATDITIGMNESDNLEVRIMSLLNTRKVIAGRTKLLLVATALLLTVPCVAAAKFGLSFDLGQQDQSNQTRQAQEKIQKQEQERAREELKRAARQLREQIRVAQQAQRPELQEKLKGVERALTEQEKVLQQYEEQTQRENDETLQQMREDLVKNRAGQEAQVQQARERLAQLMAQPTQLNERQVEEVRRAQRELELLVQEQAQGEKQKEEKLKSKEREEREKQEWKEKEEGERREMEEREEQERQQRNRGAGLAAVKWAKIPMTQAIQIATSKYPGAVLQCRLFGEREDRVFYQVVIATGDGDNQMIKYVWVNAIDGQILKTEEEKRTAPSGARLKAISVPNPEYPATARAARVAGEVTVQITVDEQGNVIAAKAVSGHPLLQAAAVSAAREAKFEPALLEGQPVKVTGVLTYNFEPE